MVTPLSQECDIETHSCPLHSTIETPWGQVRFTMRYHAPWGGRCGYHRTEDAERELGIDVMAQHKVSVLKAQGRQDGAGMELTARSVNEPNNSAVLRAAMAVTAFVSGGDAPGDVDDEVALTLPSQRPMIFQDSEVEMRDRVGVLETAVDNAFDHSSLQECAKMLRYVVFRTHLDVLCRALSGDPHARKKPGAVPFHSGVKVVRTKLPPERNRLR